MRTVGHRGSGPSKQQHVALQGAGQPGEWEAAVGAPLFARVSEDVLSRGTHQHQLRKVLRASADAACAALVARHLQCVLQCLHEPQHGLVADSVVLHACGRVLMCV